MLGDGGGVKGGGEGLGVTGRRGEVRRGWLGWLVGCYVWLRSGL